MDVTPQLLQDIEFREKVRGYHPDDVDDFLERVGVAFSELVDRLRQANERADAAEAALASRADVDESTLSRTLVLAQRTADAAIAEAKIEAEKLVAGARAERESIVRDAQAEARREAAALTGAVEDEVARLESRRQAIAEQSSGLEEWLGAQRSRLESVADDLGAILADPERLRVVPAPGLAEIREESTGEDPTVAVEDEAGAPPLALVDTEPERQPEPAAESGPAAWEIADEVDPPVEVPVDPPVEAAVEVPVDPPVEVPVDPPPEAPFASTGAPDVSVAEVPAGSDTGPGPAHPEPLTVEFDAPDPAADVLEDRPSRVSVVRSSLSEESEGESVSTGSSDTFLEELRRAVEAPTDLVQTDEDRALSAFFEQDDDEPRRRFGRKK